MLSIFNEKGVVRSRAWKKYKYKFKNETIVYSVFDLHHCISFKYNEKVNRTAQS